MNGMDAYAAIAGRFAANRSTPGLIADAIRGGILDGTIEAGQQLVQDDLARAFGTSRIPVREALRQLESDGIVAYHPHRGASVALLSTVDVAEIYEMRAPLEKLALRLAVPNLDAARLTAAQRTIDDSAGVSNAALFGRLNWRFHEIIYEAADRPRLLKAIKNLYIHASRWPPFAREQRKAFAAIVAEHRTILRACRRHDAKAAVKALDRHLIESERLLVSVIEASRDSGTQRTRSA
jgi:DNA-binding GntR family transcriptional regulator